MHLWKNANRVLLGNNMTQQSKDQARDQQLAEDCAQHMFAQDAASKALGISIGATKPGCATATMTVTDVMLNGYKTCHGGMIFSLADSAFAFACNSQNQAAVAAG